MNAAAAASAALPLPREELRLLPTDPNRDGSPAWLVQDPVCNRFYRIGWMDFEMLLRWGHGTPQAVAQAVNTETTLDVEPGDVESLARFLDTHGLVQRTAAAAVDELKRRADAQRPDLFHWLLHNYLFIRVPLVRPQDLLARLLPRVRWIFSGGMLAVVALLSLVGLMLVAHQWDTFRGTFVDHMTLQGLAGFALALAFAKMLHEMGHALTATRYGVRVAHMGVALVVMFPMLYTDTSESWKLTQPKQRLAIAAAGILTELALAGLATLAWSLAPDGALRNAMFFLATTTWILSVAVNASPFMRFDGYFILSDLLDFPNLHDRAGNLARAWVRRTLLGLPEPWPEVMPRPRMRMLIAFALTTWVYRFVVFLGIAVLVYLYFFKLLGLFLMGVEVFWFIGRPVARELQVWWSRRAEVKRSRKRAFVLAALLLLLVLAVPWRGTVHGAGYLHAQNQHAIFSPRAGQLMSVPRPGAVKAGDLLFSLAAPDLKSAEHRAQVLAEARALELVGLSGLKNGEERRALLQSERDKFLAEAGMHGGEQSRMQLVAPIAGRLADVDPQLWEGAWVQSRQPLGIVVDDASWVAEVFVSEEDVARIRPGAQAQVHMGTRSSQVIAGHVLDVDTTRTANIPVPMLDAATGGPMVTLPPRAGDRNGEKPMRDSLFRVRIALDRPPAQAQMTLCSAVITGESRSLAHGMFDRAASVLVRESGF